MLRMIDASFCRSISAEIPDVNPAVDIFRASSAPLKVAVSHQPAAATTWSRVEQI